MKTVNAERIAVQNKLNSLYPEGAPDAARMRDARDYIESVMGSSKINEKALVKQCLAKVIERAGDHAAGDPIRGDAPYVDYGMRGWFYFYTVRDRGTKEEREIAENYFEKVVKDESSRREPNLGRIERAADMLLFLGATGAAKTLREAGEKLGKETGRMADTAQEAAFTGIVKVSPGTLSDMAERQRAAHHVNNIGRILEAAPEFAGAKPAKDNFRGFNCH